MADMQTAIRSAGIINAASGDKVTTLHPAYLKAQKERVKYQDVIAGTRALRAKGTEYLPQFPAELPASYEFRRQTATLLNITQKTVRALCGLVFQNDLTITDSLPEIMQDGGFKENIDNRGRHLQVFARDVFEASFEGAAVILVDSSNIGASDLGQQKQMGLRPYFVQYDADSVINWDYRINPISKQRELSLIVFREINRERVGTFTFKEKVEYLVYFLNETGQVVWQRWRENDKGEAVQIDGDNILQGFTALPVCVIGELGAPPPLMDLVYKNIEHYQSYSDYKTILHKTCVPQFFTVNQDGDPTQLAISGDAIWKLGEGGSIGFAEPSGASIEKVRQSLEDIKAEMAMLGLSMLSGQTPQTQITATERMLDVMQETSDLQTRAQQLKDELERALGFMALYMRRDVNAGGSIELGASWAQMILTPEEMKTLSGLVDMGQLSLQSFLWYLQKAGKLPPDITAEDEIERIENESINEAAMTPIRNAQRLPNEQTVSGIEPAQEAR